MLSKIEKKLGWVLLICVILITSVTKTNAKDEREKSVEGGVGDTLGGQPSCRC